MKSLTLRLTIALAVASFVPAAPAVAQTAVTDPAAMVGKPVVDQVGKPVGQVIGAQGNLLFVKTDKHETSLPTSSFTLMGGKLYIAFTQAQLNAEIEKGLAQVAASLAPGAPVKGTAGSVVGTIEAIDPEFATIKLASGQSIKVPRSGIAGSTNGAVIGMTQAQLEAAVAKAAAPATSN